MRTVSRRLLILGVALGLLVVGAVWWAPLAVAEWVVARRFRDVPEVTSEQLAARLAAGEEITVLDVRERAEFEVSHLPGARWIDPAGAGLNSTDPSLLDRSVVVYCSVGWRSALAVEKLRAAGMTRVENLRGSIFRWANEGRPLVDDNERPTTAVHSYGRAWRWMLRPR